MAGLEPSPEAQFMNGDPTLETTPGSVPLTQSLLAVWDTASVIRWCDLATAGVQASELWVLAKHDLSKKHSLPK
jgi:hypothetical protein